MSVLPAAGIQFDVSVPVAIVGAGAAGLVAALAAREAGIEVLVLERDLTPRGSTSLSAGLVPAAGTRVQREAGIEDSPAAFAADIMAKAGGEPDATLVGTLTEAAAPTIDWLSDRYGLPFTVIADFGYPGHSAARMHGLPTRSGEELMDALRSAAEGSGADILTGARVDGLYVDEAQGVRGVALVRPDGTRDRVGCDALVLACNGYGGNRDLVREHIPTLAEALYFGHPGNQGEAVLWGRALGAATRHLSGHQGHGSVAEPGGILITWATITEGGFQVNAEGRRFSNEARGYSEQATPVLQQPGGIAWTIFDERIAGIARQLADFRNAEQAGLILSAADGAELARRTRLPEGALEATLAAVAAHKSSASTDAFGRDFAGAPPLSPPYKAVRVTGALFHSQGGLVVDERARVLSDVGRPLPNLFAAGGAACGVSGSQASGYLSGNGLLTAVALGKIAGESAAALAA
jgi:fumarate reductase flavoprotein subunit